MTEEIKQILEIIQALFEKLGCSGSIDFTEYPENLFFNIQTSDAGLLIGEDGERLKALNHVARKIIERVLKDRNCPRFLVDVNDYQKQKFGELKDIARLSAQRVRYFKKEIELKPMPAYERRIIHATLTEYPDIVTASTGEGQERRVVIKPL
jgi:spoIIIJ-associated protein